MKHTIIALICCCAPVRALSISFKKSSVFNVTYNSTWLYNTSLRSNRQHSLPQLSSAGLIDEAGNIMARYEERCLSMPYNAHGVWYSEGLALISAAALEDVDIIIESGTANGQSTELMARFFLNTPTVIYTIDLGGHEGDVASTEARLSHFSNVHFIRGNSFEEIPRLLSNFQGKRIGVFIDGPKEFSGMQLCLQTIKSSVDVKFCSMHDISPAAFSPEVSNAMEAWGRTVLLTWKPYWRSRFGHLDNRPGIYGNQQYGWGVSIIAGQEALPLGVYGDDGTLFHK